MSKQSDDEYIRRVFSIRYIAVQKFFQSGIALAQPAIAQEFSGPRCAIGSADANLRNEYEEEAESLAGLGNPWLS